MSQIQCPPAALKIEYEGATRNRYLVRVPVEHTFEDVCHPNYFGMLQASKKLLVGDIIEIEWVDYSRFGELQIRHVDPAVNQVVTAVRSISEYASPDLPEGWSIEFRNPAVGHAVLFNGQEKANGFPTTEGAARYIAAIVTRTAVQEAVTAVRGGKAEPVKAARAAKPKGDSPPPPPPAA